MAKVNNPLHCVEGTGKISKGVIFRNKRGLKFTSKFYFPGIKRKYTPSLNQINQRKYYLDGVIEWHNLSQAEKEIYIEKAKGKNLSGYNLFIQEFLTKYPYAILGKLTLGVANFGREP